MYSLTFNIQLESRPTTISCGCNCLGLDAYYGQARNGEEGSGPSFNRNCEASQVFPARIFAILKVCWISSQRLKVAYATAHIELISYLLAGIYHHGAAQLSF
jgi:hypothetical protein